MTRLVFQWAGKKGTYIRADVLHRAPKGHYKGDTIKISIVSRTDRLGCVMTPYEALVTATALLNAVTIVNAKRVLPVRQYSRRPNNAP